VALILAGLGGTRASAATYDITIIPANNGSGTPPVARPYGINSASQVAGFYVDPTTQTPLPFIYDVRAQSLIPLPPAPLSSAQMLSINNGGVAVGLGFTGTDVVHSSGVTYDLKSAQWTSFQFPGACSTQARGVNNIGTIVGLYTTDCAGLGLGYGFTRALGNYKDLSDPPVFDVQPREINSRGVVVGNYQPDDTLSGFVAAQGTVTTFNYPGAVQTAATGINDSGVIVGCATWVADGCFGSTAPASGYILSGGTFTDLVFPSAIRTYPQDINSRGQVAGNSYLVSGGPSTAWIYDTGTFTPISVPGNTSTRLNHINELGVAVGDYTDLSTNIIYAFVAIPRPSRP
jgi:hypothetical protein